MICWISLYRDNSEKSLVCKKFLPQNKQQVYLKAWKLLIISWSDKLDHMNYHRYISNSFTEDLYYIWIRSNITKGEYTFFNVYFFESIKQTFDSMHIIIIN